MSINKNKDKLVCFNLPFETYKKLLEISKNDERTISAKVRIIINEFLKNEVKK